MACKSDKSVAELARMCEALWEFVETLLANTSALLEQRCKLQEREKTLSENYSFTMSLLEDLITEAKENSDLKDCILDRWNLEYDVKSRMLKADSMVVRLKSEYLEEEMAEAIDLFDLQISSSSQGRLNFNNELPQTENSTDLKNEIKKLKEDNAKLTSEAASLVREKNFAWQQYNLMERNFTDKLASKQAEVDQSNQKIAKLISTMEVLQSSLTGKDEEIQRLKTILTEKEADANLWKEKASKISSALEISKNQTNKENRFQISDKLKTPATHVPSQPPDKGRKSGSKRKTTDNGTSKLFSSSFKVPKLKVLRPL